MKSIKTDIIPYKQAFAQLDVTRELNYEAICIFTAIGFFLDQDCYFKDEVCLRPGTINSIDENGILRKSEPWFQWHYVPSQKSYVEVLDEFTVRFENIINQQVKDQTVILPLSGGLDSRTQATALKVLNKDVKSYSYQFKNGYKEARISAEIAQICGFPFQKFVIEKSYLWDKVEDLSLLNRSYAEFTHPRQMAVLDQLNGYGDIFSLGHWGDVLFDGQNGPQLSDEALLNVILKKIVKPSGLELANKLWAQWGLDGQFLDYLKQRIKALLDEIKIDNSSAKIRAFKSLHWAPRWTTANLSLFETVAPISLPYYANEMCEFVCEIPEDYLMNRQLQIDYIKRRNPELAKVTWHQNRPFNLLNYDYNKVPYNLPYRIVNKAKRMLADKMGHPFIQRNWELQFLGNDNDNRLKNYLFNKDLGDLISEDITKYFYAGFKNKNSVVYSHAVSMLLTLSLWQLGVNENTKA